MAFPIIILAAAAASAIYGARKGKLATVKHKTAEKIIETAEEAKRIANEKLQLNMELAERSLQDLGRMKQQIYEKPLKQFVQAFSLIQRVQLKDLEGFENMSTVDEMIDAIQQDISLVDTAKTLATSSVGGALTAFGAYSAVTTFSATSIAGAGGAATVGTGLIAMPTTAAAASGLLASTVTLVGSAFLGPTLALAGKIADTKAGIKLNNALKHKYENDEVIEELHLKKLSCIAIREQADLYCKLLGQLNSVFWPRVKIMREAIEAEGLDPNTYKKETLELMSVVVSLAKTISTVLNTNIVNSKGHLDIVAPIIYKETVTSLNEIKKTLQLDSK